MIAPLAGLATSDEPIDRLVKEGQEQRSVLRITGSDLDVGWAPLHRRIVRHEHGGAVWRLLGSVSTSALR
jgi:hypothetical protein